MENKTKVRFLIVRFSSIGDIVLTTPVIRMLKKQVENAEIHYLTKSKFLTVLKNNPYIDKLHVLEDTITSVLDKIENENIDYIIDLHNNLRTSLVKRRIKATAFSFNKLNYKKWLLVNFKINLLPKIHIVDRYLNTCSVFDVVNDNQGLDFFIDPINEINPENNTLPLPATYFAFVIGAQHATKRLPNNKIADIIAGLNHPVLLMGDSTDGTRVNEISSLAKQQNPNVIIYNGCGIFNLQQSASLIKKAAVVITHDTGLMHIAAAYKKKIISVWGNTVPEFGMFPYMPDSLSKIFEITDLKCRPCSKIGYTKCPKKHFNCMNKINTAELAEYANKIIDIQ